MADFAQLIGLGSILIAAVTIFVHILFAIHVYRDAEQLENEGSLIYGPAALWVLATLVSGVIAAVGYWLVNRSSLRRD